MRLRTRLLLILAPILVVSVTVFGLRWFEYAVTFHPTHYDATVQWTLPERAEDVWFETADKVRLHGWFIRAKTAPSMAMIVFFHGNAGTVKSSGWIGRDLSEQGFDVLLFDYRGFGKSDGTVYDESDIYRDADAAFEYVTKTRGVGADKIVLYGQSLGSAAAVDVASRKKCGAIVLESGMSSADAMASAIAPWLPRWLHFLAKNRFESAKKISKLHCPVLITHGGPDDVIPTDQGRALFAAANEPKRLIIYPGFGHDVSGNGGHDYLQTVGDFLRTNLKRK